MSNDTDQHQHVELKWIFGFVAVAGLALMAAINGPTSTPSPTPTQSSSTPTTIEPPRIGAEVSEKYFEAVRGKTWTHCKRAIENLAKYDLRWTDWGIPFDRWNATHREDGLLRLIGDGAEAQNGYGGWVRVNYICTVDPKPTK